MIQDLQTYQLRPPNPTSIAQNVVMTSSQSIPTHTDEALKKREMRLLKNRYDNFKFINSMIKLDCFILIRFYGKHQGGCQRMSS